MRYGKRQGLGPFGIATAILAGLVIAGITGGGADADGPELRGYQLRPAVRLSTHRVLGSSVHVTKAPLRMLEALPGCANYPCGRQTSMLPSVNGARHGATVAIGGDFIRNGRPVHDYVHNGRVVSRGIRNGDVFMLKENGEAIIGRGHDNQLRRAEELFGGYPQVLAQGEVPSGRGDCKNDDGPDGAFCLRQARQGVGLSRDGETVILLEVDKGHGSRGMLLPQFGRLFRSFGAYDALNVDGGGSAVMWTRQRTRACDFKTHTGCLVSRPAYRAENPPFGERRLTQSVMVIP